MIYPLKTSGKAVRIVKERAEVIEGHEGYQYCGFFPVNGDMESDHSTDGRRARNQKKLLLALLNVFCAAKGLTVKLATLDAIELVFGEVWSNAFLHGSKQVEYQLVVTERSWEMTVTNSYWRNGNATKRESLHEDCGRGLELIAGFLPEIREGFPDWEIIFLAERLPNPKMGGKFRVLFRLAR